MKKQQRTHILMAKNVSITLLACLNFSTAFAMFGQGAYNDDIGRSYSRVDFGYNIYTTPSAISSTASATTPGQGIAATNEKTSSNAGVNVGFGYKSSDKFRSDLTLTYRPNIDFQLSNAASSVGRGSLNNYTIMVNGYYGFNLDLPFEPYAMGGIGVSNNTTNNIIWSPGYVTEYGNTENQFAWQVGAGLSYPLAANFLADFNYQFVDLGAFNSSGLYSFGQTTPTHWKSLYSNQLQIGLRYYI